MRTVALFAMLCGCPPNPLADAEAIEGKGELDAAAQAYVQIVKGDPANLAAWDRAIEIQCTRRVDVGACLSILDLELDLIGQLSRHQDALGNVLELRARARLDRGLAEAALEDLARAERAVPNRASLKVVEAKALASLGRAAEARKALLEARRLDPGDEEANALFADLPADPDEAFGGAAD